jgi:predicted nuclease of predicted toxin-antitoxin system
MRLVIDMNLSPDWVAILARAGHCATHWASVGSACATDHEILTWAREQKAVVLTHDLDFGAILAATDADAPSVLQVRT